MIYALGLKKWVEFRESKSPPKPFTSSFSKMVEEIELIIEGTDLYGFPRMIPKKVKRKKTFSLTTFAGGERLGVLKARQLYDLVGKSMKEGELWAIPDGLMREKIRERLSQ